MPRGISTVVEQSTHDPKFKGSYPAGAGTWGLYYKTFYAHN
jgi:hypothetical protein